MTQWQAGNGISCEVGCTWSKDDRNIELFSKEAPTKCALGGQAVEGKIAMVGEDKNFVAV